MPYLNIPESTLAAGASLLIAKATAELKIKVNEQLKQLEQLVPILLTTVISKSLNF